MTRDEIIKLAREAGIEEVLEGADDWICFTDELVRFAALVAAAEREHNMQMQNILIDAAVKAEREACAKVAETMRPHGGRMFDEAQSASFSALTDCAAAIRARGQA